MQCLSITALILITDKLQDCCFFFKKKIQSPQLLTVDVDGASEKRRSGPETVDQLACLTKSMPSSLLA